VYAIVQSDPLSREDVSLFERFFPGVLAEHEGHRLTLGADYTAHTREFLCSCGKVFSVSSRRLFEMLKQAR
jgi:hypothetical protein